MDPENSGKPHSCQAAEQHSQGKEAKAWLLRLECVSELVSVSQLQGAKEMHVLGLGRGSCTHRRLNQKQREGDGFLLSFINSSKAVFVPHLYKESGK